MVVLGETQGEPFRCIAALELMVLIAICVFGADGALQGWHSVVQAALLGITDNLGNSFILDKWMTTSFPSSIILMEVAAQLARLDTTLHLGWAPREQNVEADALTNEEFQCFYPDYWISLCCQR